MSQSDIYDFLHNKRLSGDQGYYTVNDLFSILKINKRSLRVKINKLYWYGYLEVIRNTDNNEIFVRARSK